MKNELTMQLHAREVKLDKNTFIACSACINEKWYKVKFRKDCEVTPKTKGLYDLTVDLGNCTLQKGKPIEINGKTTYENDTLWVSEVVELRKYTEDEIKEINRRKLGSALGL